MRISVTRSGGFAGVLRRAEVDTETQPDPRAWEELVARADFDVLTTRGPAPGRPDRFVYTIVIDGRIWRVDETELTGPLRELVERVFAAD